MSEVYDPGADDEFLDPAMLCVGFASHAREIEPPHDRAVTFALFAQNSDDQFLEQSEYFVAAAKEALKEALATPDEPSAPSITPFKGHELLCYVAGLTLDQELIAQTDEDRRNFMLAQLAAKRRDATLVPQDPKSQESYKVLAAARNNDVDLARAIKDPRTRAVTLADIVCRLDRADTETFAQDPSYLLALEDEAWQELTTLVHEKVFYVSDLVNFAVNRGPRLILDITEKSGRLAAVSGYGFASRIEVMPKALLGASASLPPNLMIVRTTMSGPWSWILFRATPRKWVMSSWCRLYRTLLKTCERRLYGALQLRGH